MKNLPNGGNGRPKGVPNKATTNAREAIARFVDGNTDRLQGWLDEIAKKHGPAAAFKCVVDLLEYHVPKLARTELTGREGEPIVTRFIVETHSGKPPESLAKVSLSPGLENEGS